MDPVHDHDKTHASVFQKGIRVWIPNPYPSEEYTYQESMFPRANFGTPVWVPGTVVESFLVGDSVVTVVTDCKPQMQTQVSPTELYPRNTMCDVDDMVSLGHLHEAALLNTVQIRYTREGQQQIYTMAGPILLAVNPYMLITDSKGHSIYDETYIHRYREQVPHEVLEGMPAAEREQHMLPPHVFSVADSTLVQFLEHGGQCQSVVISGESGAGKTECTKQIMKFLTTCCSGGGSSNGINKNSINTLSMSSMENPTTSDDGSDVGQKLLKTNPILEALGNAKTVRNDNSSRFGKFIRIYLRRFQNSKTKATIYGGSVQDFLLEKSRVVFQMQGERNYHIFYQMIAGMSETKKEQFRIKGVQDYRYLDSSLQTAVSKQSQALKQQGGSSGSWGSSGAIDDKEDYETLLQAMNVVGINGAEQEAVFSVLSGVLALGNIQIEGLEAGQAQSPAKVNETCEWFDTVCMLLGLDKALFKNALVTKERSVGASPTISSPMTVEEALDGVDALAKGIYGKLFKWVVHRVNAALGDHHSESEEYIGILDIFGFEVFDTNSFEQLCINFANEKLQQLFTTYVFKLEQEVYRKEEINFSEIEFTDNQRVIDLIEKRPLGLFSLLDEACLFPRSSDESFLQKCQHAHKTNPLFAVGAFQHGPSFSVRHSAAEVAYSVHHFLAKNRDRLNDNVKQICAASDRALVAQLFAEAPAPPSTSPARGRGGFTGANAFLGSKFREDMRSLMDTLGETSPHFVRCLKPNALKKPRFVDPAMVLHQLQYLGVLDSIRIRHSGFSFRAVYRDFYDRFVMALPELPTALPPDADLVALCRRLVDGLWAQLSPDLRPELDSMVQFGRTRVFLRQRAIQALESLCEVRLRRLRAAVATLQRAVRAHQGRIRARALARGFARAQAAWRAVFCRGRWLAHRLARHRLGAFFRIALAKARSRRRRRATRTLQRFFRDHADRARWLRARRGARLLHSLARGFGVRQQVLRLTRAALSLQRAARRFLAKNRRYWGEVRAALLVQALWRGRALRQVRDDVLSHLEIRRAQRFRERCIRRIQAAWKAFLVLRRYRQMRASALTLQYLARSRGMVRWLGRVRTSARLLQRVARGFLARCEVRDLQTRLLVEDERWRLATMREREMLVLAALQRSRPTLVDYALGQQPLHPNGSLPRAGRGGVVFGSASSVAEGDSWARGPGVVVQRLLDVAPDVGALEVYPGGWTRAAGELEAALGSQGGRVEQIALGESHSVVLTDSGAVYTWGWGDQGQLGGGAPEACVRPRDPLVFALPEAEGGLAAKVPRPVARRVAIRQVAAGDDHSIALSAAGGRVFTWGSGARGQLGLGPEQPVAASPRLVQGLRKVSEVGAGAVHCVALVVAGSVYVWGAGAQAGLGVFAGTGDRFSPQVLLSLRKHRARHVQCGRDFSAVVTHAGELFTWGEGRLGQLGLGDCRARVLPTKVRFFDSQSGATSRTRVVQVACGPRHCAALGVTGLVYTWGAGETGQLGHGDRPHAQPLPRLVERLSMRRVKQVVCAANATLVLSDVGEVFGWGALQCVQTESSAARQVESSAVQHSEFSQVEQSQVQETQSRTAELPQVPVPVQVPIRSGATRSLLRLHAAFGPTLSVVSVTLRQKALQARYTDVPLLEDEVKVAENSVGEGQGGSAAINASVMSMVSQDPQGPALRLAQYSSPKDRSEAALIADWKEVEQLDKRQLVQLVKELAKRDSRVPPREKTMNESLVSFLYRGSSSSPVLRAKERAWVPPNYSSTRLTQTAANESLRAKLLGEAEARSRLLQPDAGKISSQPPKSHQDPYFPPRSHQGPYGMESKQHASLPSSNLPDMKVTRTRNTAVHHDRGDGSMSDFFTMDHLVATKRDNTAQLHEDSVTNKYEQKTSGTQRVLKTESPKSQKRDVLESYRRQKSKRIQNKSNEDDDDEETKSDGLLSEYSFKDAKTLSTEMNDTQGPQWGGRRESAKLRARKEIETLILGDQHKTDTLRDVQEMDSNFISKHLKKENTTAEETKASDEEEFDEMLERIRLKASLDVKNILSSR